MMQGDAGGCLPWFPMIVKYAVVREPVHCRIHFCGLPQLSFIRHVPGIISSNSNYHSYRFQDCPGMDDLGTRLL